MNWTCPYCNRDQTVVDSRYSSSIFFSKFHDSKDGILGVRLVYICCANSKCLRTCVSLFLHETSMQKLGQRELKYPSLNEYFIKPEFTHKVVHQAVPPPIAEDYYEACKIAHLSPKASATLARRCIQGMIRDFCGISRNRLIDEINELEKLVNAGNAPQGVNEDTVEAINNVRKIGNIGAYMGKDIDHIIPVEENEARLLIQLIEILMDDWYVARFRRQKNRQLIAQVAEAKAAKG